MADFGKALKNKTIWLVGAWIFFLVLIFVLFIAFGDDIKTNLKATRFFDRMFGSTPEFIANHEDRRPAPAHGDASDGTVINLYNSENPTGNEGAALLYNPAAAGQGADAPVLVPPVLADAPAAEDDPGADDVVLEFDRQPTENPRPPVEGAPGAPAQGTAAAAVTEEFAGAPPATASARLCFMSIEMDGSVVRKQISRKIVKTDAPLTNNIRLLLAGPQPDEIAAGCRTFIPDGSQLLSAVVSAGIAFLNFSEEFEFNQFGPEGTLAALQQVVFTATEFSTVTSVQFLMEGQKIDYLSEGVWIGSPLSRASFK